MNVQDASLCSSCCEPSPYSFTLTGRTAAAALCLRALVPACLRAARAGTCRSLLARDLAQAETCACVSGGEGRTEKTLRLLFSVSQADRRLPGILSCIKAFLQGTCGYIDFLPLMLFLPGKLSRRRRKAWVLQLPWGGQEQRGASRKV